MKFPNDVSNLGRLILLLGLGIPLSGCTPALVWLGISSSSDGGAESPPSVVGVSRTALPASFDGDSDDMIEGVAEFEILISRHSAVSTRLEMSLNGVAQTIELLQDNASVETVQLSTTEQSRVLVRWDSSSVAYQEEARFLFQTPGGKGLASRTFRIDNSRRAIVRADELRRFGTRFEVDVDVEDADCSSSAQPFDESRFCSGAENLRLVVHVEGREVVPDSESYEFVRQDPSSESESVASYVLTWRSEVAFEDQSLDAEIEIRARDTKTGRAAFLDVSVDNLIPQIDDVTPAVLNPRRGASSSLKIAGRNFDAGIEVELYQDGERVRGAVEVQQTFGGLLDVAFGIDPDVVAFGEASLVLRNPNGLVASRALRIGASSIDLDRSIFTGFAGATSVSIGDFYPDSEYTDFAIVSPGELLIYRGLGEGRFELDSVVEKPEASDSWFFVQFLGVRPDGVVRFIATTETGYVVFERESDFDASWMARCASLDFENETRIRMATGDLDGNGSLDVVLTSSVGSSIHFLRDVLTDSFICQEATPADTSVKVDNRKTSLVDFDGQGADDLLLVSEGDVLVVTSGLQNNYMCQTKFELEDRVKSINACLLDEDAEADLLIGLQESVRLTWSGGSSLNSSACMRDASDAWSARTGILATNDNDEFGGTDCSDISSADLDGDGDADLLCMFEDSNSVSVFLNNGKGQFRAADSYSAGLSPKGMSVGDLDADGIQDFLIAADDSGEVSLFHGIRGALPVPWFATDLRDRNSTTDEGGISLLDDSGSSQICFLGERDGAAQFAVLRQGKDPNSDASTDFVSLVEREGLDTRETRSLALAELLGLGAPSQLGRLSGAVLIAWSPGSETGETKEFVSSGPQQIVLWDPLTGQLGLPVALGPHEEIVGMAGLRDRTALLTSDSSGNGEAGHLYMVTRDGMDFVLNRESFEFYRDPVGLAALHSGDREVIALLEGDDQGLQIRLITGDVECVSPTFAGVAGGVALSHDPVSGDLTVGALTTNDARFHLFTGDCESGLSSHPPFNVLGFDEPSKDIDVRAVALADGNRDTLPDLVVTFDTGVTVFPNTGGSFFSDPFDYRDRVERKIGVSPTGMAVVLNDDGVIEELVFSEEKWGFFAIRNNLE